MIPTDKTILFRTDRVRASCFGSSLRHLANRPQKHPGSVINTRPSARHAPTGQRSGGVPADSADGTDHSPMSHRQDLEQFVLALEAYDKAEYDVALARFEVIAETSKIQFNMALIHATIGEHEMAVARFNRATALDQFMAIAYYQRAVSLFLLRDFSPALEDCEEAMLYMRSNDVIDYTQLGLSFKLFLCEILFNRALCLTELGRAEEAMTSLIDAATCRHLPEHGIIQEAIEAGTAADLMVFSIQEGTIFRPPIHKVRNLPNRDYLGQAKLIAAVRPDDAFVGFTGSELRLRKTSDAGPVSSSPTVPIKQLNKALPRVRDDKPLFSKDYNLTGRSLPPSPPQSEASSVRAVPPPSQPQQAARRVPVGFEFARRPTAKSVDPGGLQQRSQPSPSRRRLERYREQRQPRYSFPDTPSDEGSDYGDIVDQYASIADEPDYFSPSPRDIRSTRKAAMTRAAPQFDGSRLKVKVVGVDADARVLTVDMPVDFIVLVKRIENKLAWHELTNAKLRLRVKDEDDELVCLDDQDDLDDAVDFSLSQARSRGRSIATLTVHVKR
ncbi:hypothetical protein PYCC9005_001225 [Savitreella phatthalungensis]